MKKTNLLILTIILLFSAVGCGTTNDNYDIVPLIETVREQVTVPLEVEEYSLPTEIDGVIISWTSNVQGTLTEDFITIQSGRNVEIFLTASFSYEDRIMTALYTTTILVDPALNTDLAAVNTIKETAIFTETELTRDITLPLLIEGVTVTWQSSDETHLSTTGEVTRPSDGEGDSEVTLTATFTLNDESATKTYIFTVLENPITVVYQGYYAGAGGLSGDDLKLFLHELIDDHTVKSYGDLRDLLQVSDEDPNNPDNVILLYTGVSVSSTWDYGATWNREHVWPRSHGDLEDFGGPAFSDMHHIRPSNPYVNGDRSNLDFDMGGSLVPRTDDCFKDGDSFEPRDEVKGDVARMIFYMAVRYEGDSGELDLEINELVNNSGPYMGLLSVLIEWHLNDLPDTFELNRNEVIYGYQGNRNPFIDNPEFVELIWAIN